MVPRGVSIRRLAHMRSVAAVARIRTAADQSTLGLNRNSARIHARWTVGIPAAQVVVEMDIAVAAIGLAEAVCLGSSRCRRWVVDRGDGVYEPRDIYGDILSVKGPKNGGLGGRSDVTYA